MIALERLDTEIQNRDFSLLPERHFDQVRRLVTQPRTSEDILYERLVLGCGALDTQESDFRWQLWELLLTAYRCCQIEIDARNWAGIRAETQRIRTDPKRRELRRRLAALNQQSIRAHLAHERGSQVPQHQSETDHRQPKLILRKDT